MALCCQKLFETSLDIQSRKTYPRDQDKHSDIAPEAVSKLLEETSKKIKSFKTTALARLVKAQAKVPRKRKKRDEEEDPTFTPGMQLTVSTIVQRSCYLQGRIA